MKLFLWRLTRNHAVTTEALPAVVAQDMILLLQWSVTVSNTVHTELIAYFTDCKNYLENSALKFCVTNANKYTLLTPLLRTCCQLQAWVERVFVCGQMTQGKKHQRT